MKPLLKGFIVAVALLVVAAPAWADTLSVSADAPVSYSFSASNLSSDKASGVIVGLWLPFLAGVAVEHYKVTGTDTSTSSTVQSTVTMYDGFLDLPIPLVDIRLGGGLGTSDYSSPTGTSNYDSASLHQYFVSVGIPFGGVFDVHVGYHSISGNAKNLSTSVNQAVGGKMVTLGLKVGL